MSSFLEWTDEEIYNILKLPELNPDILKMLKKNNLNKDDNDDDNGNGNGNSNNFFKKFFKKYLRCKDIKKYLRYK